MEQVQEAFSFVVSDETLNSKGFRIKTSGLDIQQFLKNPVALWQHDKTKVIGKWQNLRVVDDTVLIADLVLDSKNHPDIYTQVKEGFIRSASIGFHVRDKDIVDNEIWVLEGILEEISLVAFGANKNALRLSKEEQGTKDLKIKTGDYLCCTSDAPMVRLANKLMNENLLLKTQIRMENDKKAVQLVERAITEKRIFHTDREIFLKLAQNDYEATEKVISRLPVYVPLTEQIAAANRLNLEASQNKHESRKPKELWDLNDYRKYAPQELESNNELYQRLLADFNANKKTRSRK